MIMQTILGASGQIGSELAVCEPASNIDPGSASKVDPPQFGRKIVGGAAQAAEATGDAATSASEGVNVGR